MLFQIITTITLYSLILIPNGKCNSQLNNVLNALDRALNYCDENSKRLNLDAAYGVIVAKAHLSYITNNSDLGETLLEKIRRLQRKVVPIGNKTVSNLEPTRKHILFAKTVLNPDSWYKDIDFRSKKLSNVSDIRLDKINTPEELLRYFFETDFDENGSDECIMQILHQQPICCQQHYCYMSPKCYRTMKVADDQPIAQGYGVTHSLLYLQIIKTQKCRINETVVNEKILRFCSYIHAELTKNRLLGYLTDMDDLLLEQVTLCGFEGFSEFFAQNIIEHINQIQEPSGCFGGNIQLGRRKREANVMGNGCIDHTTGLGLSALSITLRFLVSRLKTQ